MDVFAEVGFRRSPGWLLVLALLVAAQAWLTLRLFGPGDPIACLNRIGSDDPVLNGRHPLHYYHGLLGNRVWHDRRATSCYDPAFQAGYLKTPVFDAGSRPAELFFLVGGPSPASYKIGLAFCCLVAPLAFALAGRGAGLGAAGACVSAIVGGALWWSPSCRALLESGDIDLLVGGVCVPVYLSWLARFRRTPGPLEWTVIVGSAAVGWLMQPLLMVGAVALSLLFQIWVFRGGRFAWHLALLAANIVAISMNLVWLWDWILHVWMYVPYGGGDLPARLWPAAVQEWEAFLPADPADIGIASIGLLGFILMLRRQAAAAWLLGAGAVMYVAAGGAGRLWPVAAELGSHKALGVGVWCCGVPCAYALAAVAGGMGKSSGVRPLGIVWLAVGLAGLTYGLDLPRRWEIPPLTIGLGPDREGIVRSIREGSTPDGRVLWEDVSESTSGAGWSALLPELTQRPFLGGLSADICFDHFQTRLVDGRLVGRPIGDWSDDELQAFLERYNVTRAVCRTPASSERLRHFSAAKMIATFPAEAGVMFGFDRRPTYFLKGRGQVTQMDWKRVALADLEPDETGIVVLSLHHHANWRVSPGYVLVERDVDVSDPIPLIRLRLPGPVARVTMTWKGD